MEKYIKELELELKLKGSTEKTIETYTRNVRLFLKRINKDPVQVTKEDVKEYLADLISKKISVRSLALKISVLRFFFKEVLNKGIVKIKAPKIPKSIPIVLTKEEVTRLLKAASTKKSLVIMKLLYATGMRVSECAKLKVNDLELDENLGWIRQGKGNKDRVFYFSEKLSQELREYIQALEGNQIYLFPGKRGHITTRNIQQIVKNTAKKASIKKKVSAHKLRHTCATHNLQKGVDIRVIQEMLGHSSLSTTQIYTKVSQDDLKKVKNILDDLNL